MEIPESVRKIIEAVVRECPDDIPRALEEAERRVKRLSDYADLIASLVRNCLQELIYDERHAINRGMKDNAGCYGGPAKVSGMSSSVREVYVELYRVHIAGAVMVLDRWEQAIPLPVVPSSA